MKDLEFLHFPIKIDDLPDSWTVTSFKKIVTEIQTGFACGQHNSEGEGVPHLRPMNISRNGELILTDARFVDPEKNELRVTNGDILFNNTNSPALVGKTTLIETQDSYAFSNHMTRIRVPVSIIASFVSKQFHFLFLRGYFQGQCKKHVNQASISRTFLNKSLPFVLAPKLEQKRIADKIDDLQTKNKKAKQALESAKPLLDKLRQSILTSAFRGDLTSDWRKRNPDIEPASVLLERIRKERRKKWEENELAKMRAKGKEPKNDKWKSKYKEPDAIDTEGLHNIPQSWEWEAAINICDFVVDCHNKTAPYKEDGIPLVRTTNIRYGKVNMEDTKFVDQPTYEYWSRRCKPLPGDILFTREAPMGEVGMIPKDTYLCMGQRIMLLRTDDKKMLEEYLLFALQAPYVPGYASRISVGGGVKHMRVRDVNKLPLPIAPLAEQKVISEKISKLLEKYELIKKTLLQLEHHSSDLDQSILSKAFNGELVTQNPSDESATALLDKILAEQAEKTQKKKRKKKV